MTETMPAPEVAEGAEAPAATAEETARRGRPRPTETVERDNRVLAAVSPEGSTRDEIVQALNGEVSSAAAYLSLFRLRREGRVERAREGSSHKWRPVAAGAQPEAV